MECFLFCFWSGPESSAPINSLAVHANTVFASTGQQVIRYLRGKEVTSYDAPEASSTLGQIMIFGEQLLALKEDGTGLIVWSIETGGESCLLSQKKVHQPYLPTYSQMSRAKLPSILHSLLPRCYTLLHT